MDRSKWSLKMSTLTTKQTENISRDVTEISAHSCTKQPIFKAELSKVQ